MVRFETLPAVLDRSRPLLKALYPRRSFREVRARYHDVLSVFASLYGGGDQAVMISAPGRTEIGGNHTDHQRGRVLAAAIDLDLVCVAAKRTDHFVDLRSRGFEPDRLSIDSTEAVPGERGSEAIIRGVADWFLRHGYEVGGFEAYTESDVLSGSGLSSSAAYEIAVGQIFNHLYNGGRVSAVELAKAGQYAENVYVGKPSGLMDQMTSSVGGFVDIDFADPNTPVVTPVAYTLEGYSLCIVNTGGSHADLTADYAAIPAEMRRVAAAFGKEVLREVDEREFMANLQGLRHRLGDRALLRAIHFFGDNRRVAQQAKALQDNDFPRFLHHADESGRSSITALQNIYANPADQGVTLALTLGRSILEPVNGVCRVHGGGFAGTTQAYVPNDALEEYTNCMRRVFGEDSCYVLNVRPLGGTAIVN